MRVACDKASTFNSSRGFDNPRRRFGEGGRSTFASCMSNFQRAGERPAGRDGQAAAVETGEERRVASRKRQPNHEGPWPAPACLCLPHERSEISDGATLESPTPCSGERGEPWLCSADLRRRRGYGRECRPVGGTRPPCQHEHNSIAGNAQGVSPAHLLLRSAYT